MAKAFNPLWVTMLALGGYMLAPITLRANEIRPGVWEPLCLDEQTGRQCHLIHKVPSPRGGTSVFLLTLTKKPKANEVYAVFTVPLRIYLRNGIEIKVDGKRPFKALYEICDDAGCHAGFKFSGAIQNSFEKGTAAKFKVWTADAKAIEVPISLLGFSKAFHSFSQQRT